MIETIKKQNWLHLSILQQYVLRLFLTNLGICLFAATALFVIFDFFERSRIFVRESATLFQAVSYILLKVPFIIQLMSPVACLIATLFTIGRLSQLSEMTAMRSCGIHLFFLAKPLIAAGLVVSILVFLAGETIVPITTTRGEEIYQFDIRKKAEKGAVSRAHFWYRAGNRFYSIGDYDSRSSTLNGLSLFEFDEAFRLIRRIDTAQAAWEGPSIGWTMDDVVETAFFGDGSFRVATYKKLPLVINENPSDFYNIKRRPETMSYQELSRYVEKLQADGVPATKYQVDLASKISFPFVNLVVILLAFPFALTPARSGTMTASFIAGISIGFGYHVVHALSTSLGSAELIPIIPAAWTANILLGTLGAYLLAGMENV